MSESTGKLGFVNQELIKVGDIIKLKSNNTTGATYCRVVKIDDSLPNVELLIIGQVRPLNASSEASYDVYGGIPRVHNNMLSYKFRRPFSSSYPQLISGYFDSDGTKYIPKYSRNLNPSATDGIDYALNAFYNYVWDDNIKSSLDNMELPATIVVSTTNDGSRPYIKLTNTALPNGQTTQSIYAYSQVDEINIRPIRSLSYSDLLRTFGYRLENDTYQERTIDADEINTKFLGYDIRTIGKELETELQQTLLATSSNVNYIQYLGYNPVVLSDLYFVTSDTNAYLNTLLTLSNTYFNNTPKTYVEYRTDSYQALFSGYSALIINLNVRTFTDWTIIPDTAALKADIRSTLQET